MVDLNLTTLNTWLNKQEAVEHFDSLTDLTDWLFKAVSAESVAEAKRRGLVPQSGDWENLDDGFWAKMLMLLRNLMLHEFILMMKLKNLWKIKSLLNLILMKCERNTVDVIYLVMMTLKMIIIWDMTKLRTY